MPPQQVIRQRVMLAGSLSPVLADSTLAHPPDKHISLEEHPCAVEVLQSTLRRLYQEL